ncbi:hypothetical protein [Ferrimonas senticii]|uniref:hypothetical protein n=1 Tax=Ferrimonas senticii TaxID=394566 RepID=UPI000403A975|nr:hypothetical protein [Ferrimonas senticii]
MSKQPLLARRQFLAQLAKGTAAGAVAVAIAPAAQAQTAATPAVAAKGYQESEHIRRYYATLRGQ